MQPDLVSDPLEPGKIRDSNGPMIAAQLQRLGIETRWLGTLSDDLDVCLPKIKQASEECDPIQLLLLRAEMHLSSYPVEHVDLKKGT